MYTDLFEPINFGHKLENMLVSCYFNNEPIILSLGPILMDNALHLTAILPMSSILQVPLLVFYVAWN